MSTARITRHRKDSPDALGFEALRAQGLHWIQEASGRLWTDYNLHDPGVTLLEALCFALTDDIYAARRSVPQLLGLGDAAEDAAWRRFGLSNRQGLAPCRPLTEQDWQVWLRAQVPQARQLQMQALRGPDGHFQGLWSLRLQESDTQAGDRPLQRKALQAFWSGRNLGEDLREPPVPLRPRWTRLRRLAVTVQGTLELAEVLGELLQACDDGMSGRVPEPPAPLADPQAPQLSEGPLGRALHEQERQWLESQQRALHAADLVRQLVRLPGVVSIEDLSLEPEGEAEDLHWGPSPDPDLVALPAGSVMRWGPDWALRLRWPETAEDLRDWVVWQDGAPVRLDPRALLDQMHEWRRVMALRRASVLSHDSPATADAPGPAGSAPPAAEPPAHRAATDLLPPLYEQALEDGRSHGPGLRPQWTGYRALLEQGLMQVHAQRQYMPALYALDTAHAGSYVMGLPDDAQLPGLSALLQRPHAHLLQERWIDHQPQERRQRLLDYQLALHGESLELQALQGLPCYFDTEDWSAHLLTLKRRFAQRLPRLTQDRHAGADYSRPLLNEPDNTPPLQERLALALGMTGLPSRLLSTAWAAWAQPSSDRASSPSQRLTPRALPAASRALPRQTPQTPQAPRGRAEGEDALLRTLAAALGPDTAWLRAASQLDQFRLSEDGRTLLLVDESARQAWPLGTVGSLERATVVAQALHAQARRIQQDSEGLHLVETLLLRPLSGPQDPDAAAPPWTEEALWLLFTGWTARGRDLRFRALARRLVQREAPAHLRCRLLWLEAQDMQAFEHDWSNWLHLRRQDSLAQLAGEDRASSLRALDAASARLRRRLTRLARQQEAS